MQGVLTTDGSSGPATRAEVERLFAAGEFFWLDLDGVDDEASDLLLHVLGVHPLSVEDAEHFGQRPKAEDYGSFTYLVIHGAGTGGASTDEVHFVIAEHYLVTVHHGGCSALDAVRAQLERRRTAQRTTPQISIVYLVIDQLVDGFFPVLDEFDDRIDELEDAILATPTEAQVGQLFEMKRTLISLRKIVTPQRDLFAGIAAGVIVLPGVTDDDLRYLRDVYDHLIRIGDLVDGYRDLLSGAMDTHLSTVSNRLNVVMKQLTIIATIFLPLSFLTGFFGQNFAYLVTHITGPVAFFVFAIGLELASAAVLLYFFRRRGWLGGSAS